MHPRRLRTLALWHIGALALIVAGNPAATASPGQGSAPNQAAASPAPGNPIVRISTTLGDITVELFQDTAPVSTANFLQYVSEGFYDGTIFHRVKPGFMIQGGGLTPALEEKPTRPPIVNEASAALRNTRGTIAMARKAALRSATSQFYINVVDNRGLDHTGFSPDTFGYAVFGRVLQGMNVVDRIAAVKTVRVGEMEDVPVEPIVIRTVVAVSK